MFTTITIAAITLACILLALFQLKHERHMSKMRTESLERRAEGLYATRAKNEAEQHSSAQSAINERIY